MMSEWDYRPMTRRRGLTMTEQQVREHQEKHGFAPIEPKGKPGAGSACRTASARPLSRMNKTEAAYALILEAMKRRGEILRYEYEGITLRWADMKYTPDFLVFTCRTYSRAGLADEIAADAIMFGGKLPTNICLIEVKGAHIWSRDIVRFKGARAFWPEFQFEMHQKKGGQWLRLL